MRIRIEEYIKCSYANPTVTKSNLQWYDFSQIFYGMLREQLRYFEFKVVWMHCIEHRVTSSSNSFAPLKWYTFFLFSIWQLCRQSHRFEFEVWWDFAVADARDAALVFFSAKSLFGGSYFFLPSLAHFFIFDLCNVNFLNMWFDLLGLISPVTIRPFI